MQISDPKMTYENNLESLISHKDNNNVNNHVVIVPANADKEVNNVLKNEAVDVHEPPDRGLRGYSVMLCAFMCNGILFGIINTYSVIYLSLQRQLKESGDELASSKACKCIYWINLSVKNVYATFCKALVDSICS